MEIYGDLFMLVNGVSDYLVLKLTSVILKRHCPFGRLLCSSVFGAFYALFSLYISDFTPIHALFSLLASLLMVLVAFGKKSFLLSFFVFYLLSFFTGGVVSGLSSLFSLWKLDLPFSLLLLLGLLLFACFLGQFFSLLLERKTKNSSARLIFEVQGQRYEVEALTDSGNLLKDPENGLPVVLLEQGILASLPETKELLAVEVSGRAVLPYFRPTFLEIDGISKDACIALCEKGKTFGGYPALVPKALLL